MLAQLYVQDMHLYFTMPLILTGSCALQYNCGKVCLSLLGTWAGPGWDPATSTILQARTSNCVVKCLRLKLNFQASDKGNILLSGACGLAVLVWACAYIYEDITVHYPQLCLQALGNILLSWVCGRAVLVWACAYIYEDITVQDPQSCLQALGS